MKFEYQTSPEVCSQSVLVEIGDDGRIVSARFRGGCPGSLLAVGNLVSGMTPEQAIAALDGTRCGGKRTSCPDQLAQALKAYLAKRG